MLLLLLDSRTCRLIVLKNQSGDVAVMQPTAHENIGCQNHQDENLKMVKS